jgi:NAD(P)-dependent dehydrogenase (short-subunit alcohol dehydrogenase family)
VGKRCVITGAGRGIGLEWARVLLNDGNTVVATSRSVTPELERLTRDFPDRAVAIAVDVSSPNLKKEIEGHAALKAPIDLLINNAGVLKTEGEFASMDTSMIEESMRVNALGPVRVTQILLPKLKQSSVAIVANITSLMGSIADNRGGGYYSYRMSKAALNMFCKSFSVDFPEIISVVLHPGWVQTRMGGGGAHITPAQSVSGMINVVSRLKKSDSGRFFNYDGKELPW